MLQGGGEGRRLPEASPAGMLSQPHHVRRRGRSLGSRTRGALPGADDEPGAYLAWGDGLVPTQLVSQAHLHKSSLNRLLIS